MSFVDELNLYIVAGHGGNGVVRWRHEKGKEYSGAAGGNGGKGGDVYARAVRDLSVLSKYKHIKEFRAENGEDGMRNSRHGKDGSDLIIDLPIGSIIKNLQTSKEWRLDNEGQMELMVKGGRGGLGNEHFKASTNTTPTESTLGQPGEEGEIQIELELVADIGLVGLPNAGKSSLLNSLTRARAKVGSYAFTTLEPNLGEMYGFILADIPGLIEGASQGKGLGHKFLRHVKRTKMILHCISLENEDVEKTYKTVRRELENYGGGLTEKKEVIVLTKTDLVDGDMVDLRVEDMKRYSNDVYSVSINDKNSVKELADSLTKFLRNNSKD